MSLPLEIIYEIQNENVSTISSTDAVFGREILSSRLTAIKRFIPSSLAASPLKAPTPLTPAPALSPPPSNSELMSFSLSWLYSKYDAEELAVP